MRRRAFIQSAAVAATALAIPRHQALGAVFSATVRQPQELDAITGDGQQVSLTARAIADLRASLRGPVLLRGNAEYDDARRVLNPSFDKYPALIVQPTGAADVRTAVNFARENRGLLLAVKCGGHSASGQSTCNRGMMIDLSRFRHVRVDPQARRAWVSGGTLLGQVDHETMACGLVTPMGTVSHTGVGGLVTGGGFGRVARRFGLSIDNLVAVNVVTADGELRRASATENQDLFWGVRGGGGNFGIVTSFEFQLHPMQRQVTAGRIVYPISKAREVLTRFAEYGREIPDDLDLGLVMAIPRGREPGVIMFGVCHSGPVSRVEQALAPLRQFGTPLADTVAVMDYVAVQRAGDISDPRAQGTYLKSGFVPAIPPALVSAIIERFEGHPQRGTAIFFQVGGGAIARVPAGATAFAQRDIQANMLCGVDWKQGDDPSAHIQWIKQYWSGLERFTHGFYVNDLDVEASTASVRDNFRQNHDRLVAVKNRYDPRNLFRLNPNVKPTV
jgi:FAD/FMN-containing dehydrogenase